MELCGEFTPVMESLQVTSKTKATRYCDFQSKNRNQFLYISDSVLTGASINQSDQRASGFGKLPNRRSLEKGSVIFVQ